MSIHICQREVKAAEPPASGYVILFDDKLEGFGLRVTAAGAKSFVYNYRVGGEKRRCTIGKWPEWTADAARQELQVKLIPAIHNGADPVREKKARRTEPKVADLATEYIEQHALPHKKPSSVKQDRRMIDKRVLPVLGKLKVSAVSKRDIKKLHNSLRSTPYEANRVKSLLSKMFSLAIEDKLRTDNPCKGIKRFEEPKHDFWLTQDQLHKLEIALNEYPDQNAANAIRLLMMTGSREGEVLNATWEQFDLGDRETWTKPSHATKEKKTENVPLMPPALALLRQMQKSKTSIYLFPRKKLRSDEADRPRTTVRDCWEMSCRKAGLCKVSFVQGKRGLLKRWKPTIRINDLRHTFASHLVQRGNSLYLVGKLVGHTQAATTQRYAHVAVAALRAVANDYAAVLEMPKMA